MSVPQSWDGFEVSASGNPYFHLDKVGDKCMGYLVKKSLKLDDMKTAAKGYEVWQRVYTIVIPEGQTCKARVNEKEGDKELKAGDLMDVYGRMPVDLDGKKVNIIASMEEIPLGTLVGFKFTEQRKPTEKGHQGAKIVVGYNFKEVRKDLVEKAMSEAAFAPSGSDLPF